MKKVLFVVLAIAILIVVAFIGYSAYVDYMLQRVDQQSLSQETGFEVSLPKYLPDGFEIASYGVNDLYGSTSTKKLVIAYVNIRSGKITLGQFPLADVDSDTISIERTKELYSNQHPQEILINKYPAVIGKAYKSNNTLDKFIIWNDDTKHFNIWLDNPEALSDEELIKFAESLY